MRKPVSLISIGIIIIAFLNIGNLEIPIETFKDNSDSAIDSSRVVVDSTTSETSVSIPTSSSISTEAKPMDEQVPQCESEELKLQGSDSYHVDAEMFIDSLAFSEKVEDKLSYALYRKLSDKETRLNILLSFHDEHPTNNGVFHELMRECSVYPKDPRCSYELIETILELDPNNDATWINAFMYFAAHRDTEKLEWAYEQALKAPYSTNDYVNNIFRYIDTLEAGGNTNYNQNLLIAIGTESAKSVGWAHLSKYCSRTAWRKDLAGLCLDIASLIENANSPYVDNLFAQGLQKEVHQMLDNKEQAGQIEQNMKKQATFFHEQYNRSAVYLFHDESLTREWLVQFRNFGEYTAAEYVVEEVEIRTQDENYFPCLRQSS